MSLKNPDRWRERLARKYGAPQQRASAWAIPGGTTAATVLLSFGRDTGWWPFGWGVIIAGLVILFSVITSSLAAANTKLEEQDAADTATETARSVNALALYLEPILRTAAEVASHNVTERRQAFARLAQQLVDSIASAYRERQNLRSVLYELCYDEAGKAESLTVVAQATNGDREDARDFTCTDLRGQSAIDFVLEGKRGRARYVEDLKSETVQQQDWHGTGQQYRTYVSVAVFGVSTPYGMITIDAPNVDDITEDDTYQMRLAAGAAAILFAVRGRGVRSSG